MPRSRVYGPRRPATSMWRRASGLISGSVPRRRITPRIAAGITALLRRGFAGGQARQSRAKYYGSMLRKQQKRWRNAVSRRRSRVGGFVPINTLRRRR